MRKQWKGFVAGLAVAVIAFGLGNPAVAALVGKTIEVYTGVNIYIDDVKLNPTDVNGNPVEVFVYNGTTYLPVRAVGEAVGKIVQWEGKTNSVYLGSHTGDGPAVWLQDLDYYTGKSWETESSMTDNLGKEHTNIIHSNSNINNTYKLNGQYSMLSGTLFQQYQYRSDYHNTEFAVYGDGRLLYSAQMCGGIDPIDFTVDLSGVLELKIEFTVFQGMGFGEAAISNCGLWT